MKVISSNIDEVVQGIRDTVKSIDFRSSVGQGMMAEAIREKIVTMIAKRSINFQMDGEGAIWYANEKKYAQWKLDHYGSNRVGVMSGQMLSILSLKGTMNVQHGKMTLYYGIGKPSDRHSSVSNPKKISKKSSKPQPEPTDIEKGSWFTEGDEGRNRMPRGFFELDDAIMEEVVDIAEEYLDRILG
jgi:hypothetical protein